MKAEQFNKIFEEQIDICRSMLVAKAEEYASDTDRLRNFKQASHMLETDPIMALGGMMAKHTISVYDMIQSPNTSFSNAKWDEKITDHINYLILLRALVYEAQELETTPLTDKA